MFKQRLLSHMLGATAFLIASVGSALASTTITGTVEAAGKYLVTAVVLQNLNGVTYRRGLRVVYDNTALGEQLSDFAVRQRIAQIPP